MKEIRRIARAKINLGLDVVQKRDDGYHDVKMIMQTISLHDKLRMKKIASDKVRLECNLNFLPTDERNLVCKVIAHIREIYKIQDGVFVDLYKVIPVGAGLAGGSTDAAQAILGMNELFDLNMTMETMEAIGTKFGADIPYCIRGGTALAEGIGEQLSMITPVPKMYILVAKPKVSVSTAYVYGNLDVNTIEDHPDIDGMIDAINNQDVGGIVQRLGNVLEDVTIVGYPEVLEIKKAMVHQGALGALMSGSGSSVFGIFEEEQSMKEAAKKLKSHPLIRYLFETTTV